VASIIPKSIIATLLWPPWDLYHVTLYTSHIDACYFFVNDRGMTPRYRVTLSEDESRRLEGLTRSGKTAAHTFIHARGYRCAMPGRRAVAGK
jgi:hypothetical protein